MKTAKATRKLSARATAKLKAKAKANKRKARPKVKAKAKAKSPVFHRIKARARAAMKKKKPVRAAHMPATAQKRGAGKVTAISDSSQYSQYARQAWVRLASDSKELIRRVAADSGLSPYIAHFAVEAAEAGKTLVATPATEEKDAAIMVRFADPQVKKMVAAVAAQSGVSLSAYAAHFALQAAKAGRVMPEKVTPEKEQAAAAAS